MELRQLEYFVAVVEEASFTRAAARLHVAQPGVSAQIRRLERELGEDLLDRSGRTVRPTSAGAALLPYARAALGAVAGARLAVDELRGLVRGRVAIGTVVGCGSLEPPGLLADFHRDHPAIALALSEANSDRLVEGLLDGQLDLAIIGLASATPAGIDVQVVVDERLVAAVAKGHALARRKTVTLDALRDQALISLPTGTGLRAANASSIAAAGVGPQSPSRRITRTPSWSWPSAVWGWRSCPSRPRAPARPSSARSRSPGPTCAAGSRWPGGPTARSVRPRVRSLVTPAMPCPTCPRLRPQRNHVQPARSRRRTAARLVRLFRPRESVDVSGRRDRSRTPGPLVGATEDTSGHRPALPTALASA